MFNNMTRNRSSMIGNATVIVGLVCLVAPERNALL